MLNFKQIKSRITDAVMAAQAAGQLGAIESINPLDLKGDPDNWYALVKGEDGQAINNLKHVAYGAALGAGATDCTVSIAMPSEIIGKNDGKPQGLLTVTFTANKKPEITDRAEFFAAAQKFAAANHFNDPKINNMEGTVRFYFDKFFHPYVKALVEFTDEVQGFLTFEPDQKKGMCATINYVVPELRKAREEQD